MSHELRTLLNAVLGFAQLLEMEVNADSARRIVEHILSGGRHLLKLINEALDIGRIEAGRVEMFIEPANIAFLLQQAINLLHRSRPSEKFPHARRPSRRCYLRTGRRATPYPSRAKPHLKRH